MNVKWDNDVRLWNSCTCGRGGFVRVRNRSCAASLAFVRIADSFRAHLGLLSCARELGIMPCLSRHWVVFGFGTWQAGGLDSHRLMGNLN